MTEPRFLDHKSTTTGLESWIVYQSIDAAGRYSDAKIATDGCQTPKQCWYLTNTFVKKELSLKLKTRRQPSSRQPVAKGNSQKTAAAKKDASCVSQRTNDGSISTIDAVRHSRIRQMIALLGFTISMCLFFWVFRYKSNGWIGVLVFVLSSVFVAAIFVAAIGFAWQSALEYPPHTAEQGVQMITSTSVDALVAKQERSLQSEIQFAQRTSDAPKKGNKLNRIVTGLELSSIELTAANRVEVSGKIWHRYDTPRQCSHSKQQCPQQPEVLFKGASETSYFNKSVKLDGQIHLWQFKAILPQRFHPSLFPLEQETIDVVLQPVASDETHVVVPDIDGYQLMIPKDKPGISDVLERPQSHWNTQRNSWR